MRKIFRFFEKLQRWFLLTFCDTKIKTVQCSAFKVTFRKFTMEIKSVSGNFTLKTLGMVYPNAFLYDALTKGDENLVHWYCNRMYELATLLLTDQGLFDDVQKGEKVQLAGFGTFEVKSKPAREGINPKTQEKISIAETKTPVFKFGKAYKDSFN